MSSDIIGTDNPLSADQISALRRIMASMIPASTRYSVPGADDPQIFADIVASGRPSLPLLTASLQAMTEQPGWDSAPVDSTGLIPTDVSAEDTAVTWYRQAHPQLTGLLMALAAQCYYRDERVMASLDMEARPPYPQGYELPESDWSLLDPVRKRGIIYRQLPAD